MSLDHVHQLKWTQLMTSTGDAELYIAPRADGQGAVPVLRLTPNRGMPIAFALTPDELTRIHQAATRILTAAPANIEAWLDGAANAVTNAKQA